MLNKLLRLAYLQSFVSAQEQPHNDKQAEDQTTASKIYDQYMEEEDQNALNHLEMDTDLNENEIGFEGDDEIVKQSELSKETIQGRSSQVERILLDRGKNSFSIMVGSGENVQKMYINLTNSFDGLALPSYEISDQENMFYTPQIEDDIESQQNLTELEVDYNKFQGHKLKEFITFESTQNHVFKTSLNMYYLTQQVETKGYELYQGGGYIGFTPSSWSDEMGIFHMFQHLDDETDDDTSLNLYSMQHVIGLEMHHSTKTSLNYMSIGWYDESIVRNPDEIMWYKVYCEDHWEIYVSQIKFSDTMLASSEFGLRARIAVEEYGIIVLQSLWQPIREILEYRNNFLICKDGNEKSFSFENMRSYCYYEGNCLNLGLNSLYITMPDGKELEIVKEQYLKQRRSPFICEIMIQAQPDKYLQQDNDGIDIIIGQPLLFNYYTVFSVQEGLIGFYETLYTDKGMSITKGAFLSICLFLSLLIAGCVGCCYKYKQSLEDDKVKIVVRGKSDTNVKKLQVERGSVWKTFNSERLSIKNLVTQKDSGDQSLQVQKVMINEKEKLLNVSLDDESVGPIQTSINH